jgi:hypothetical protein
MFPRYYRLTVVGCALAWFLLGFHVPALHQMTHHGRAPSWTALLSTAAVALLAVAGLLALLLAPRRGGAAAAT